MAAVNFPKSPSLLALALVLGTLAMSQTASAQCGTNIALLEAACSVYVAKTGPALEPSAACCTYVNLVTDIQCLCGLMTAQTKAEISMEKTVGVARLCGKAIAAGTICGDYTVPA